MQEQPQEREAASTRRRDFLKLAGTLPLAATPAFVAAQAPAPAGAVPGITPADRVFITNEDSNTVVVIDPARNVVDTTINLTSFDEDARPPFRFVTGGVAPTHAAMIHKPLYHGCIDAHGAVPSPDGRLIATSGRGSSNIYLIDTTTRRVIGNKPNPALAANANVSADQISTGILVGREPHEPTFTRNGRELWVAVRGEDRIAIIDVELALKFLRGDAGVQPIRGYLTTLPGPAQVWFTRDSSHAFVASQKVSKVDVFSLRTGADGHFTPQHTTTLDIAEQDRPGFTPFLKTTPEGDEVWFSHKLSDTVSCRSVRPDFRLLDAVPLGTNARPNHVEFVSNAKGRVVYASLARVDDGGPGGVASSRVAIIDRASPANQRRMAGSFFSHGREAHGLWTNPENTLLYVAHEQDELPGTPNAGQTVCSAFDVRDPFKPEFIAQIPLGELALPSGPLRNKKSINLVYVRVGSPGQTA
jgi:YVTN family beta-propeller protein